MATVAISIPMYRLRRDKLENWLRGEFGRSITVEVCIFETHHACPNISQQWLMNLNQTSGSSYVFYLSQRLTQVRSPKNLPMTILSEIGRDG